MSLSVTQRTVKQNNAWLNLDLVIIFPCMAVQITFKQEKHFPAALEYKAHGKDLTFYGDYIWAQHVFSLNWNCLLPFLVYDSFLSNSKCLLHLIT